MLPPSSWALLAWCLETNQSTVIENSNPSVHILHAEYRRGHLSKPMNQVFTLQSN